MKILIVMSGFFPGKKYGGPPVSINNFCTLMSELDCYIVTRNHDLGEKEVYKDVKEGWNVRSNCKVLYLSDAEYNIQSFENIINQVEPDLIYLQGLFQSCIVPCLKLAKKYSLKVLLAPRGELCAGAFKKKYKKIPYLLALRVFDLLKNIYYQSTSKEETEMIQKYLKADPLRILDLPNIPSIPKKRLRRTDEKKSGEAKFIFLSRIVPKKNLSFALECLKKVKGKVQFDIYGPIEDENYWNQCKQIIKKMPDNIQVTYKGLVSHDKVNETFSQYDCFLFPTFSENYGHVIAEALMAGCPVITSDQTPWNDLQKIGCGGSFSLDSRKDFIKALKDIIQKDKQNMEKCKYNTQKYINEKLDIKHINSEYNRCFYSIFSYESRQSL